MDDLGVRADHLTFVLLKHSFFRQFHCQIERGLTSQCREKRIWAFTLYNFLDHFPGQWLNICAFRRARIGHDRGWVAVDQYDLKSFFP